MTSLTNRPDAHPEQGAPSLIPSAVVHVSEHRSESANEEIRRRTRESLDRPEAGGPEALDRRLAEPGAAVIGHVLPIEVDIR